MLCIIFSGLISKYLIIAVVSVVVVRLNSRNVDKYNCF